jgi:uncharacterized protein DUF2203
MQHERHYSLDEANAALPAVAELLERLRAAREGLSDTEAREALAEASPSNGGGAPGKLVSRAFLALRDGLVELREREVVLRDLERGLVDFPAIRDGREIYLCWEEGEDEIAFWHEPDAGFAGRKPIDDD